MGKLICPVTREECTEDECRKDKMCLKDKDQETLWACDECGRPNYLAGLCEPCLKKLEGGDAQ